MSEESQDIKAPDLNNSSENAADSDSSPMLISERMREVFKDVSFENYLQDLASIVKTPDVMIFPSHPELMPKVIDKLKEIYDTAKIMSFEFVDMESLRDDLTLMVDFYKSGLDGNLVEEPEDLIFGIASKLVEIISRILWLNIYNKYSNHTYEAKVEKTIIDFGFGLSLKRNTVIKICNNDNFIDIMKDELKYQAFEKILDNFIVRQWFMDSFAAINLATIKNYKGRYLINQGSRHTWTNIGLPQEVFNSDIIIDEWIDQGAKVKNQALFIGNFSFLNSVKVSNSAIINREPIMINSANEVRQRDISEVEPDGDFKPGIHYQVILKLQLNLPEIEKPWIILSLSDETEPKGK